MKKNIPERNCRYTVAIITPSYAADLERCRLLCDSIDEHVSGIKDHYILVDDEDYRLFLPLAGSNRYIVNEEDILPSWLHAVRAGLSKNARKLWLSRRTWPMRGWHVQQLRRIAIVSHISDDALLYCDSDMMFVRDFDGGELWNDDKLRLYRKESGIGSHLPSGGASHMKWTRTAARLNELSAPTFPAPDYINNLISWERENVIAMCNHIEKVTGKHWLSAIGSNRSFSECQIYGAFADGVLGEESGHWHAEEGLCKTYWSGARLQERELRDFVGAMSTGQVAIGIQSFTKTDPALLRGLLAGAV